MHSKLIDWFLFEVNTGISFNELKMYDEAFSENS